MPVARTPAAHSTAGVSSVRVVLGPTPIVDQFGCLSHLDLLCQLDLLPRNAMKAPWPLPTRSIRSNFSLTRCIPARFATPPLYSRKYARASRLFGCLRSVRGVCTRASVPCATLASTCPDNWPTHHGHAMAAIHGAEAAPLPTTTRHPPPTRHRHPPPAAAPAPHPPRTTGGRAVPDNV
jgi:hypothetical protein